jgi:septal ring factor EnvC (AmiA/AmiB activator)
MAFKIYFFLFLIIAFSSVGFAGYKYYKDSQETIRILTENNAKLEVAVALNEETINSLQADYASAQTQLSELNAAFISIRRQNQQLADKLQQVDLTAAAIANPEAIERAVNRGSENAGRCFELLSGAELTERERNAENGIAFNKECPWLYDDYRARGLLSETPTPAN